MLLFNRDRQSRMCIAIAFGRKSEEKCRDHEGDDAFFFRGEDEPVPQFRPGPTIRKFQRLIRLLANGRERKDNCL